MVRDELPGTGYGVVLVGARSGALSDMVHVLKAGGFAVTRSAGTKAVDAARDSQATVALFAPTLAKRTVARLCRELRQNVPYLVRMLVASSPDLPPGRLSLLKQGLVQGVVAWPASDAVLLSCVGTIARLQSVETRLRESRRNYEGIFDNNHAVMLIVDPAEGRIVDANPAAVRYYGWSRDEMRTKRISEINTLSHEELAQAMARARAMNQNLFQFRHRLADGSVRDVEVYSGPVRLRGQDLLYSLIFDVSERKRVERELAATNRNLEDAVAQAHELAAKSEAASRAKSEFLAHMSHEIRTPLNGASGMLQLLQISTVSEEQAGYVSAALGALHRLNRLLLDVLDLSRIEAGKLSVQDDEFELAAMPEQLREMFALAAASKNLRLEFLFDEKLPRPVRGDEARLRQILFNLVGNAVKFTHKGFVRVTATVSGNPVQGRLHVLFTVEDSGVGIAPEDMDGIFEAFVQGETGEKQAQQGAGLGLAIVLRLTGLMGGEISVESVPGEGTLFALSLPFALVPESLGAQNFAPGQDSCNLARWRVLVAEDDPVSALYLQTLLTRCGHEVVVVHDGRQAVDMIVDRNFDLVFMDVQMPVMDGLEAARVIRSRVGPASNIPIVALTAYAMVGDRERFLAAGMNDHISKPVRIDEVSAVLDRILAGRVNG